MRHVSQLLGTIGGMLSPAEGEGEPVAIRSWLPSPAALEEVRTRYWVSRVTASRYLAAVFATMSSGSSGPGGVLSHVPASTSVVR